MAEIRSFTTGSCRHPECIALKGGSLRIREFPAKVWLISGRKRWLFDTGYSAHFMKATARGLLRLYRMVTPVSYESGGSIAAQLAAEGLSVDGIILSHFHGDHIGGLRDFDCPVVCSAAGWHSVKNLRGFAALRNAFVPELIPAGFEERCLFMETLPQTALPEELSPFETGYALPESDGDIILLPLPGHAAGHMGAFVRTDEGWVLLAADAAWAAQSYRDNCKPTAAASLFMHSRKDAVNTLSKLHALWQKGVPIILSHE